MDVETVCVEEDEKDEEDMRCSWTDWECEWVEEPAAASSRSETDRPDKEREAPLTDAAVVAVSADDEEEEEVEA